MPLSVITRTLSAVAVCLGLFAGGAVAQDVTYAKDVAPILRENCVTCHRPGEVAPMSLQTYEETRPWARSIAQEVGQKRMPPWHATAGLREYTNDRSLDAAEIDVIQRWVAAGAPRGDTALLPPLPTFTDGWQLGEPDLVLSWDAPYQIVAEGDDEYRCFVLDPQFEEDQWVDVIEVIPGNRITDHHIVIYVDQPGETATRMDEEEPGEGYTCFGGPWPGLPMPYMVPGWGPGYQASETPEGSGYLLRAGSKIVVQMHFHKNGTAQEDLTRVGLRFARRPTQRVLYNGYVLGLSLQIPPGDPNYVVTGRMPVREDITVHSLVAHMHYLGKSMDIWATLPDGTRVDLVTVPSFDFYWQTEYLLDKPQRLPKGSMMHMQATFDNSPESPYQHSDPPRLVTFGEQTTDEMAVAVFFHTLDGENLNTDTSSP